MENNQNKYANAEMVTWNTFALLYELQAYPGKFQLPNDV